jgi:hypothetical protein
MPPKENSWLVQWDWLNVVKQSKAALDCRLSLLYLVLQPDDLWLPQHAHRAKPDALMLLKLTELYFAWAAELKPKMQSRIKDFFLTMTPADLLVLREDEVD